MTGESRLPSVPIGDLQTEAFRMKSGPAGGRLPRQRREAWRGHACVVGSLHVQPGRGLPALGGPAPAPPPASASFRTRGAGEEEGGWASRLGPASALSYWTWVRAPPPTAFPLERACKRRTPLGRADLGTKFKDFKSTSWRLLEARALRSWPPRLTSRWQFPHLRRTPLVLA